ncbi:glycosyl transferase family 2 domain protein [[Clostridium] sordellii ATCC 9714]|nr:glycosyl transferase family 2 domain protein [[Clostridium] sordellii ATCC 9714] [Paeniclostridium sordellii ATCC 9714]
MKLKILNLKNKKFKEYKINFTSNLNYPLNLKIKHFYLDNTIKESFLACNNSITLSNYYLTKLSFEFLNVESFKECKDFKVEIIEIQKNFNLETPENSKKIDEFINIIEKQVPIDSPKTFSGINIASILDEFSYECFNPDVNLINLNYKSCLDEIKHFNPDFLFVESAWKGKNNSWENKIASTNAFVDSKLLELINYCKNKNIPTVFWNKEGLINLKFFKLVSLLFDYIFVTDENIIKEYISEYNLKIYKFLSLLPNLNFIILLIKININLEISLLLDHGMEINIKIGF